MTVYRMFITEEGHRSCVRIFKAEQLSTVRPFLRQYCAESAMGSVVELIRYKDGVACEVVYRVKKVEIKD